MWTPLSVSRWIFLLTLAVVMLLSATEAVDSTIPFVNLPCCAASGSTKIHRIKACYEQKPREDCEHHAFLVINKKGRPFCISPASPWLQHLIKKGELRCPPDVSSDTTTKA
ncbi:C-C motif chemokine 4-like [Seriola aureovittata]|uniref:C-C motif chemokine 4-like n=1 Tax=Seriola aureovittata TaxID=2871759 RepID=UPI0024BDB960|nr:C-C motif chemokine 4-like [Seriola aureovittata]